MSPPTHRRNLHGIGCGVPGIRASKHFRTFFPSFHLFSLPALSFFFLPGDIFALAFFRDFRPPDKPFETDLFLAGKGSFSNIPAPFPRFSLFFFSLSVFFPSFHRSSLLKNNRVPTSRFLSFLQRLSPLRQTIRERS